MAEGEHPEYILPIFFTGATQALFKCVADEDVTEENPYKVINKQDILQVSMVLDINSGVNKEQKNINIGK